MKNKAARVLFVLTMSASLAVPAFGRGFGGGFGGGGFGGGGFGRGGFGDAGRGGFAAMDHPMEGGGFARGDYGGGGFGSIAGTRPAFANGSQMAGHPSQLSADGGFGSVSGNTFEHNTNINSYGHNYASAGYHPTYTYGSHPYNGYHPYGACGYHPYGYHPYGAYGYHPYYGGLYGYPGAWGSAGFMEATMWTCMGMSTLSSFLGLAALTSSKQTAANNVTYEGTNVYVGGQPAPQYYQQAQQLASTALPYVSQAQQLPGALGSTPLAQQLSGALGSTPLAQQLAFAANSGQTLPGANAQAGAAAEKWEPLGVYALTDPGQKDSTTLFQLAINKDGIVRGNYLNQITNEKAQIHGALNKETQQICWSVGENSDTVFGTNLSELMKKDSNVVVQFGPNDTKQMALIRQKPPSEKGSPSTRSQPEG